ncbi:uncharacterized protein LOC131152974 [Malania oleifera]|uniref:uncharacterized protein LOC131152974 n=1 Tax=Malania oleifera TaxID=397392 RepID=UPI0025AE90D6|nr:uncharacterized protein LOC131152974 [Malania oleifera]
MGPLPNPIMFPHFLALSLLAVLFLSLPFSSSSNSSSSIYDVLRSHGLPMGILPKGIQNFTIDATTGRFEVYLDRSCNAKFENEVHYDFNVSGTISYGQIGALSGVTAQELFLWFPVKGIRVDIPSSGLIYFDVGVIYKRFSLSLFETPPDCVDVGSPDLLFRDGRIVSTESKSEPLELGYEIIPHGVLRAVS